MMARTEYHVSTLAEIRAHASEDNVAIYVDNDIDAGSAEWETINIGSATEIIFQNHKLLRPLIKSGHALFTGGTIRNGKLVNVFEKGSPYMFDTVNLIDCAVSLRASNTSTAIFRNCIFSRCNVNIDFPNLGNAAVFDQSAANRYPRDSLFTINGNISDNIFLNDSLPDDGVLCAEGCRFDGKVTGIFQGFAWSTTRAMKVFGMDDCIVNLDITDCSVGTYNHSNPYIGAVWYNSDIFNKGRFPSTWKAVTSEELRDPEVLKARGLNVVVMG